MSKPENTDRLEDGLIHCKHCPKTFYTKFCFKKHEHKWKVEQPVRHQKSDVQQNSSLQSVSQHHSIESTVVVDSSRENDYEGHQSTVVDSSHENEGKSTCYQCKKCPESFENEAKLQNHIFSDHGKLYGPSI